MASVDEGVVLVQVVDVGSGREISWGSNVADRLDARFDDIGRAIRAGVRAVSVGLVDLPVAREWQVGEVSAKFGITLTAEAGVLLSRAGAETAFEVAVTFRRKERSAVIEEDSAAD
jgi:hypothetical protein